MAVGIAAQASAQGLTPLLGPAELASILETEEALIPDIRATEDGGSS